MPSGVGGFRLGIEEAIKELKINVPKSRKG